MLSSCPTTAQFRLSTVSPRYQKSFSANSLQEKKILVSQLPLKQRLSAESPAHKGRKAKLASRARKVSRAIKASVVSTELVLLSTRLLLTATKVRKGLRDRRVGPALAVRKGRRARCVSSTWAAAAAVEAGLVLASKVLKGQLGRKARLALTVLRALRVLTALLAWMARLAGKVLRASRVSPAW